MNAEAAFITNCFAMGDDAQRACSCFDTVYVENDTVYVTNIDIHSKIRYNTTKVGA